jgi:hypothetical protein
MKGELQTMLGSQYKQLSLANISKLIRWKMAGPSLHGIDRDIDDQETPDNLSLADHARESAESPVVGDPVDGPDGFPMTPDGLMNGRRLASDPQQHDRTMSRASQIKLEVFELQINSMSGEVLAILDDVRASWSRADIVDALKRQSPVPSTSFYKLTYNDVLLNGDRTLGECDHKIVHKGYYVRPSVVAVVIESPEKPVLQQALEAILSLEARLIREVATIKAPPKGLLRTAQALGSLFDMHPLQIRIGEGRDRRIELDYWTPAQRTFFKNRESLTSRLKAFDVDREPAATLEKLAPFVNDKEFNPEEIGKASVCCKRVAEWCHSLHRYVKGIV